MKDKQIKRSVRVNDAKNTVENTQTLHCKSMHDKLHVKNITGDIAFHLDFKSKMRIVKCVRRETRRQKLVNRACSATKETTLYALHRSVRDMIQCFRTCSS